MNTMPPNTPKPQNPKTPRAFKLNIKIMDYEADYLEKQRIGRGQFGAAHIVEERATGCLYVAKKMIIEGMEKKE
jgi:hypothetical protein